MVAFRSQAPRLGLVLLCSLSVGRGEVTCICDTPSGGTALHNHFTCSNSSVSAWCEIDHECMATQPWRFEEKAAACQVPTARKELWVSIGLQLLIIALLGLWWLALLPKLFCRAWPSLCESFTRCMKPGAEHSDEKTKRIMQHVGLKRLERLKLIALPACYPLSLLTIYSLSAGTRASFELGSSFLDNSVVGLNIEGIALSLLSLFTLSFPKTADRILTLNVLDALMMLLFVAVGCHTIPSFLHDWNSTDAARNYTNALNQSVTCQIVLAMCLGSIYKVSLANVANLGLQAAVVYTSIQGHSPDGPFVTVADLRDVCEATERSTMWRVLWNAVFIQLVSVMVAVVLSAEAKAMIGEKEASRSQTTARDLLSVMCDSVVALHKDFTFRGDCSRMMASLLMNESMSALDPSRRSFMKYVSEEDQTRFKELIEAQEGAGLLHLHLVDSFRRKVPVQVFHTKWIDADNEGNYLLGIQEDREVDHFQSAASLPQVERGPSKELQVWDEGFPKAADLRSAGSSSLGNSSGVSVWAGARVSCMVRLSLQTEIIQQSDECLAFFSFDESLLHGMDDGTQTNVVDWLTGLHVRKIHERWGTVSFGKVNICNSAGVCYQAILAATFVPEEEVSALETTLQITLSPPAIRKPPTDMELAQTVRRNSAEQRRRLRARAASVPAPGSNSMSL